MTDAIAHRGPDDEGLYCENNLGLGHRRLSIIDLSPAGHQPMYTSDKSMVIVFNGEVYNYKEIKSELHDQGYSFISDSDTEVVLNAIHCWGIKVALSKFIGMFAFAVFDKRNKQVILARDRMGVKPLFYYLNKDRMIFGSELKALYAHPAFKKNMDDDGLAQFFSFGYTLGKSTVFQDTYKLPAAHYLIIKDNKETKMECYWSISNISRGSFKGGYRESIERLEELCESAFRYRLISDVPVGVFLSGGIDSSYLSAFLKNKLNADLEHITIGFNDPVYDESELAKKIASDLDVRHQVFEVDEIQAQDSLHKFVDVWDEPFGDTSGIPTSILCGITRDRVKVALSADGGDEMFCGYESYPQYANYYKNLDRVPGSIRSLLAKVMKIVPYETILSNSISKKSSRSIRPQSIARYEKLVDLLKVNNIYDLMRVMNEKGWSAQSVNNLINTTNNNYLTGTVLNRELTHNTNDDVLDNLMRTDLSAFLCDDVLTKVDRASMSVSLECRDPFLDHRLVEFAYSLPMEYLYSNGIHKRILKDSMGKWISPEIRNAPKRGFSIPLYTWMKGPWKKMVQEYLSPENIRKYGILNEKTVNDEVHRFYKYNGGRAEKIMLMLNFQMWAERWL